MRITLLNILLLFGLFSYAQDTIKSRFIGSIKYTPNDFFVSYGGACGNINHTIFIGFGVNRTIFQRRFYPSIDYRYSRDITLSRKNHLLPYVLISWNRLKVSTAGAHQWINPELGINYEFGERKRVGIGTGYTMLNEFWKDNSTWNRSLAFGITFNCYYIFK